MAGVNPRRPRKKAGAHKPPAKRAYRSAIRDEHAAQTKARVLSAAADLFAERGYGRTTIKAIADAAGVAPDTVYAAFGSKARLLTALIDQRLVPAGDAPNVMERPEIAAVRDAADQREQIRAFVDDMTNVLDRVGPMFEVMRTAGAVEPEMNAVYAEMNGYRLQNLTRAAGWFAANGPLRTDVERAGETLWVLASPDVARLLRQGRGWSAEQYRVWLVDALTRLLLPDA